VLLREPAQQIERSVAVDAIDEHQHALGLFDDRAMLDHLGDRGAESVPDPSRSTSTLISTLQRSRTNMSCPVATGERSDRRKRSTHAGVWGNTCVVPLTTNAFNYRNKPVLGGHEKVTRGSAERRTDHRGVDGQQYQASNRNQDPQPAPGEHHRQGEHDH
jgi:hypothetical protein